MTNPPNAAEATLDRTRNERLPHLSSSRDALEGSTQESENHGALPRRRPAP
jgi:hypothetical protein